MANPPITSIDFSSGSAVLVAGTKRFTFPIKGLPPGAAPGIVFMDPRPGMAAIEAKLDDIAALLQSGATPGGAEPTPAAGWPPTGITAGGSTSLPPGQYKGALHTDVAHSITGAGMRRSVIDGRGGVGSGHKLAWGKGIVHAGAPIRVADIGFKGGGGGDGRSDGEAAFYPENFEGLAHLVRCAIDGSENGIFAPGGGQGGKVRLVVEACVFGREAANGADDERSHDMYVSCSEVTVRNSVFCGTSKANSFKCRGPRAVLEGNFIARANGRWVDLPGGTDVLSTGNTYVTLDGAGSQNALSLYGEGDGGANPGKPGSLMSIGDRFYFRRWKEVLWINSADAVVTFKDAQVFWVGNAGDNPPQVEIHGPGKISGPNPFVFTEANRVSEAPAVPGDPAA